MKLNGNYVLVKLEIYISTVNMNEVIGEYYKLI